MVDTWSGAIIYEWIQETNDYGLVSYDLSDNTATATMAPGDAAFGRSGTPKPISPDFDNLSKHWATLSPSGVRADDYKPSLSAPQCPDFTQDAWAVSPDAQLPTIGFETNSASKSLSGSATSVPTVSATGKAHKDDDDAAPSDASAVEGDEAATSSGAANGMLRSVSGSGISMELWVVVYVAFCAVAGVFAML